MKHRGIISSESFAEIYDVDSEKYRDRTRLAIESRRDVFANNGGDLSAIERFDLMDELFRIQELGRKTAAASESVILDISSLPKRFFFPVLQILVASPHVKDLLITYTSPRSYADDAPLYEDPEPWKTLPGFGGGRGKPEIWIVSVGFLVESLRQYVADNQHEKMKILIPFPAPLAALQRTWCSIAELENGYPDNRFEKHRVDTLDMSAAFDRIGSLAGEPRKRLAFAPFGPKPTAAAMCLYAIQQDCSVHYPQPTVYHPEYSIGIRNDDPITAVNAYWVKHDGEFLYQV